MPYKKSTSMEVLCFVSQRYSQEKKVDFRFSICQEKK